MIKATKIGHIPSPGDSKGFTVKKKRKCVTCGEGFYANSNAKYCVMHKPFLTGDFG